MRYRLRGEGGQALLELALALPALLVLVMGLVTFFYLHVGISYGFQAAREAARCYAITRDEGEAVAVAAKTMRVVARMVEFDPARDIDFDVDGEYVTASVTSWVPNLLPVGGRPVEGGDPGTTYLRVGGAATFRLEPTG